MSQPSSSALVAAAAPTRNEPSCSLKVRSVTFVRPSFVSPHAVPQVAYPSMIANWVSAWSPALTLIPGENAKPTATTSWFPSSASASTFSSRFDPVASGSRKVVFSSHTSPSSIAVWSPALGRVVEGLVPDATDVERHPDVKIGVALRCFTTVAGGRFSVVAAGRRDEREHGQGHEERSKPFRHASPFVGSSSGFSPTARILRAEGGSVKRDSVPPWETTDPEVATDV